MGICLKILEVTVVGIWHYVNWIESFIHVEVWTLIVFFFIDLLRAWHHCTGAWPSLGQALSVRQISSHFTQEYFGILYGQLNDCKLPRSLSWLTVGMRYLWWYAVWLLQTWHCALWANISTLALSFQIKLFKSFGLLRCNFAKLNHGVVMFSERRGFLLATL